MLSVLPKQFHRLRLSLNGIDLYPSGHPGDLYGDGSGAAADVIDHGVLCQVQLADADLADFFFCHWSFRIPQKTGIGSSMCQAFRLPVRIADQAGIQPFLRNLFTLPRGQEPDVFLRIGQLISYGHFTVCQSRFCKQTSDLADVLTS